VAALVSLIGAAGGAEIAARIMARATGSPPSRAPWRRIAPMSLVVVAVLAIVAANYIPATAPVRAALRVRLIQPAVTQVKKFDGMQIRALARQLAELARDPAAHLVVAPETALPHTWAALPTDVTDSLLDAVPEGGLFLVGMFEVDSEHGLLNVANALRANSRTTAPRRYIKQRLVPVAERATAGLRWLSDVLALWYPARATTGEAPVVFDVAGVGVRTTICLDLAFGADLSATGAATSVIVNQSNFAALPGERVRAQFVTIARVRALEQGKPVVLVANDGPTAVIDAQGNVLAALPPGKPAAMSYTINPHRGVTPYAIFGEALWLLALAIAAFVVFMVRPGQTMQASATSESHAASPTAPP
jgi:apolipoprotein N-acyltransferase